MNGNSIWVIVVLLIVIAGGWYLVSGTPARAPTVPTTTIETTAAPSDTTVTYTDQGFSPKNITVPLGATVTFVNQSSEGMWVASGAHPTHTAYSGTSLSQHCPDTTNSAFDECIAVTSGNSYSFTFNKVGDWKYHNHINASDFGSVVVTATVPL